MNRRRALLALAIVLAVVVMVRVVDTRAEAGDRRRGPGHCQRIASDKPWPQVLEPEDAPVAEVSPAEARRVVAAFRTTWRRDVLPRAGEVARTLAPCMRSDRDYYVRRVSGAGAARRVTELRDATRGEGVLRGTPDALAQHAWVWEVQFGGWSDRLAPGGSFGGFLTPGARVIAVVHWPEG